MPSGGGTGATRATVVGGSALYLVAEEARLKLGSLAAHQLGCSEEDVVMEEAHKDVVMEETQ